MNKGLEVLQFDGPLHLVESIRQVEQDQSVREEFAERSFHGCPWEIKNVDGLRSALTKTWAEGIAKVEQTVRELSGIDLPEPKIRRRAKAWSEDGDEVCLDRLERGQPCWRTTKKKPMPASKVITLAVGVAASAMYSAEDLAWRTASAVALADLLEPLGFACEIVAYRYSGGMYVDGRDSLIMVPVKEASSPLDIGTLVSTLSPWFCRTAFFACGRIGGPVKEHQGSVLKVSGSPFAMNYFPGEVYVLDSVVGKKSAIETVGKIMGDICQAQEAA